MVQDVLEGIEVMTEIFKSPRMPRPKKDKQAMEPVHMSSRNPRHSKLSMEEKGKVVTIETEEEEEDLQTLIATAEEEEDMEKYIQPFCSTTKLPVYVPQLKGKTKILKDLGALQTPLFPNGIVFKGSHLGHVPAMKFEDWDLADSEKFPHLETTNLM